MYFIPARSYLLNQAAGCVLSIRYGPASWKSTVMASRSRICQQQSNRVG